jgi:LAGLIDADG endonuclease
VNTLSDTDLAYLAGFFDGEGSIYIRKNYSPNHPNPYYDIHIDCTNTDKETLVWIQQTTGIGKLRDRPKQKPNKDAYEWYLATSQMKEFLKAILPFLKIKKVRAEITLEFLELEIFQGSRIPENILIQREVIYQEMKEFNKKGK